jgi:hypothetical protein
MFLLGRPVSKTEKMDEGVRLPVLFFIDFPTRTLRAFGAQTPTLFCAPGEGAFSFPASKGGELEP